MLTQIQINDLEVGRTYEVRHSRKGTFWGTLLSVNGEFADFRIASGKAKFLNQADRIEGETVTVRLSLGTYYPIKEYEPIPVSRWGKDHWSTFIYIETRCVDYKGILDKQHMRTKRDKHPNLEGRAQKRDLSGDKEYPTMLRNYFEDNSDCVYDHDDWDCIEDMIAAGLIEKVYNPEIDFETKPTCKLTEKGWRVISLLRQHKANGGACATFVITEEEMNGT